MYWPGVLSSEKEWSVAAWKYGLARSDSLFVNGLEGSALEWWILKSPQTSVGVEEELKRR